MFRKTQWPRTARRQEVNEEVWHVIEGTLEVTIDGATRVAGAGAVALVPPNTRHAVKALCDSRAIVVDYPLRESVGSVRIG